MLFSIIVPVYNIENWIETCVDSILEQSYEDYEIILVDDGSTDRSGKICDDYRAKYPDKVQVIHKENEGQSIARNIGIGLANGQYLLLVDGDDYIKADTLERLSKVIEENAPDIVLSEGMYRVNDEKIFEEHRFKAKEFKGLSGQEALRKTAGIAINWSPCGKCYKNEFWKKHHFRFVGKRTWEDFQLIDQIVIEAESVAMIPSFYFYRARAGSTTHEIKAQNLIDILDGFDEWKLYLEKNPLIENLKENLQAIHAELLYKTVWGYAFLVEKEYTPEILNRSKQYLYLLNANQSKVCKAVKIMIMICGVKNTAYILSQIKKHRMHIA